MSTTRRSSPPRRTARRDDDTATRADDERGRGGSPRRAPGPTPRPARGSAGSTRDRSNATTGRGTSRSGAAAKRGPAAKKAVAKKAARTAAPTRTRRATRGPRDVRARTGAPAARRTGSTRAGSAAPARVAPDPDDAEDAAGRRRRWLGVRPGWRDAGDPHRRAIGLLVVLVGLFAVVGLRLVMVQVVIADRYVRYGESQRGLNPIVVPAGRGSIFDRTGIDLALSIPQRTIWADPRLVTDPAATARELAPVLQLDEGELRSRLEREADFVYVARQVPDDRAGEVEDLDLDGIFFLEEPKRINPAGELGRSVLGQADVDNVGMSGLELQYESTLAGEPGELVVERDRNGRTIPAGRHHVDPATPGEDLVLTLDRNLQAESERILMEHVAERGAKGGSAIISDPETGKILALVNVTVDPETGQTRLDGNNVALTANYEPGSVNKVITMAAAIEEGLVVPETEIDVPDQLQVADHTFTDSHDMASRMSVHDILAESSNVGTILVAQELGKGRLYDYLRDFGFGETTALDFPAEVSGAILKPDEWSGTSIGTIPVGQGVSVTAMQMLYAYNAIANDGVYVPPRLVDEIIDADGERRPAATGQPHRVVSPTTASLVREMMSGVVDDGTGEAAAIEGYEVAGKTGTARKPAPDGGYRWEDGYHYISTFAGFMPAGDPKLSVIVVLDEPRGDYASTTAAPAFADLARNALRLLRLPPPAAGHADQPTISLDPPRARGQAAPYLETTTTEPPRTTTTAAPLNAPVAGGPPAGGGAGGGRAAGATTTTYRPVRDDPDRRG